MASKLPIILAILLIIVSIILSAVSYFEGWITNLSEFTTLVISGIVVIMIGGAGALIYDYLKLSRKEKAVFKPSPTTSNPSNQRAYHQLSQKIELFYGSRKGAIDDKVHIFTDQDSLPPLKDIFKQANKSIGIFSGSLQEIATQKIDAIREAINRNVAVTVMILAPDEHEIIKTREQAHRSIDLSGEIKKSFRFLCREKLDPKNKGENLILKKYRFDAPRSIIVIDEGEKYAWIQETPWSYKLNPADRPTGSTFREENAKFFDKYLEEYNKALGDSEPYDECK